MISPDVRKTGDTLFLGKTLTITNGPPVPWVGATARINIWAVERIVNQSTGALVYAADALVVDNALVTTFNTTTLAWTYVGAPILHGGVYAYEIEITYADGTIESFPNNEHIPLTLIGQGG